MGAKIRVALIGVGNCASALVQAVRICAERGIPPMVEPALGGYAPTDIEFVLAFDVDANKVGKDLAEAIFAPPNNAPKLIDVPRLGAPVLRGPLLDGVDPKLAGDLIQVSDAPEADVARALQEMKAEVAVCLLPPGARQAVEFYAEQCLKAKVAFINATAAPLAVVDRWQQAFKEAGVPLEGDGIMPQLSPLFLQRALLSLLESRGCSVRSLLRMDSSGSPAFAHLSLRPQDDENAEAAALLAASSGKPDVSVSLRSYSKPLGSRRLSHLIVEGESLGGLGFRLTMTLEADDAFGAAWSLIDAIRLAKVALDRGVGGVLVSASAWLFRRPPVPASPETARRWVEEFLAGERER